MSKTILSEAAEELRGKFSICFECSLNVVQKKFFFILGLLWGGKTKSWKAFGKMHFLVVLWMRVNEKEEECFYPLNEILHKLTQIAELLFLIKNRFLRQLCFYSRFVIASLMRGPKQRSKIKSSHFNNIIQMLKV